MDTAYETSTLLSRFHANYYKEYDLKPFQNKILKLWLGLFPTELRRCNSFEVVFSTEISIPMKLVWGISYIPPVGSHSYF